MQLLRKYLRPKYVRLCGRHFSSGASTTGNPPTPPTLPPVESAPHVKGRRAKQDEDIKKTKISPHLNLREVCDASRYIGKSPMPLVLLFRWLNSTPSAVYQYCRLYHDIGLDVLTIKGRLSHFLLPAVGTKLAAELFDFLAKSRPLDQPLLVHAFSVGVYNYTFAMQEAADKPEVSANFRNRVMGQIFDSIVIGTYEQMFYGLAKTLPATDVFRRMVRNTADSYYYATHRTTRDAFSRLVRRFQDDPVPAPSLFFHSVGDPLCDNAAMEKLQAEWKSRDLDVHSVTWQRSVHAAHIRYHPEEYLTSWIQMMEKLQLV